MAVGMLIWGFILILSIEVFLGSVKKVVSLEINGSFLVRITI